jgi:VWFA-related protein
VQFHTSPTSPPRYVGKKSIYESIEAGDGYMRALAQKTGGRYYQVESIFDLGQTFGQVADELRRQYSLGYYPTTKPERGQQRQIKVRVRLPNLVVRARDSYVVDKTLAQGK